MNLLIDALFIAAKVPELLVNAAFAIMDGVDGTAVRDRRSRESWN